MKKNSWHFVENAEKSADYLGKEISKEIALLKDAPLLLFVSGGSSLTVLPYIENEDYDGVTVAPLDERFEESNKHNNFSQLKALPWSKQFLKKGGKFISTKVPKGDAQQKLAERFEKQINHWTKNNPNGRMIALFGMGSDGHTAGIFPYPENRDLFEHMFDAEKLVVSYDAAGKNSFTKRITTTNALFKRLDAGFAYICGSDKKAAVNDLRENKKRANELPAMFLSGIKKIKIVTDIE
jgi:6-phosphogluconolactonase/glucosamine-6-phosphate isomerase/deaminase